MTGRSGDLPGPRESPHSGLLREVTERAVMEAVAAEGGPLTRAEIARRTSISPPTISEAVRRLEADGVLSATGSRSGFAGAVATFYDISPTTGVAAALELSPTGIRTAVSDLLGRSRTEASFAPPRATEGVAGRVNEVLDDINARFRGLGQPLRSIAVSLAGPVRPAAGSDVGLPESASPQGVLQAADIRAVDATAVLIDSEVNFAAVAERDHGAAVGVASFAYLHVGARAGLGLGLVMDGRPVRGAHGLAGEIGYLPIGAAAGENVRFNLGRTIGRYRLRPPTARAESGPPTDLDAAGRTLGEAATAVCALVDPELVVLGGPVGTDPTLLERVRTTVAELGAHPTPVVAGALGEAAPLWGALVSARRRAWDALCAGRRPD